MPRKDGRAPDGLRPVQILRKFTSIAPGSVLIEFGNTKVLCTATIQYDVRVLILGTNEKKVGEAAERFASKLRAFLSPGDRLLGPSQAPLYRLKGRYRMHLLVKTKDMPALRDRLLKLAQAVTRPLQAILDVDPVHMM